MTTDAEPAADTTPLSMRRRNDVSEMPFTDVAVCIGHRDADGNRQETVHQIQADRDVRIVVVEHKVQEKMRQLKEDGQLVGFEPTGEYELTLKVKFIKG